MMIGVMLLWIADVSPDDQRPALQVDAYAALERAFLHAPNDGIVQATMSVVHTARNEVDAARRAILRGVELAPNNPDVLASAAWNAITADMEGPEPLEWARRAIDLNPKGPPWHRLGEGIAAFLAKDYLAAIKAMEAAPPHHKKYLFLAASHMELGNLDRASEAAQTLKANFPDYALSGDYDVPQNAALDRLFSAAEAAGVTR
jgi:tetratricopeptide (TPR) repeat protein